MTCDGLGSNPGPGVGFQLVGLMAGEINFSDRYRGSTCVLSILWQVPPLKLPSYGEIEMWILLLLLLLLLLLFQHICDLGAFGDTDELITLKVKGQGHNQTIHVNK